MKIIKLFILTMTVFLFNVSAHAAISTFDDLSLAPESYWNGSDGSGGFASGSAYFYNNYNAAYSSWDGFAYSNTTDTVTRGYANQYSAIAGGGAGYSSNYSVFFQPWVPCANADISAGLAGVYFTNTTYAYWSMMEGDSFGKKFGGDDGNDPDWFLLTVEGKDAGGNSTGAVDFYLADYRFADNSLDYVVDDWAWVDLTGLGAVNSLDFSLSSSDTGLYGMNTPAYFAMDDLSPIPEPATIILLGSGLMGIFAFSGRKKR